MFDRALPHLLLYYRFYVLLCVGFEGVSIEIADLVVFLHNFEGFLQLIGPLCFGPLCFGPLFFGPFCFGPLGLLLVGPLLADSLRLGDPFLLGLEDAFVVGLLRQIANVALILSLLDIPLGPLVVFAGAGTAHHLLGEVVSLRLLPRAKPFLHALSLALQSLSKVGPFAGCYLGCTFGPVLGLESFLKVDVLLRLLLGVHLLPLDRN